MSAAKKLEDVNAELEKAVAYYKKRIDELSGENIKGEYRTAGLRKELKQKRSAFALLSKLTLAFGKTTSVDEIFKATVEAISQTLDMDRAFILGPGAGTNVFSPVVWQGLERLTEETVDGFKDLTFEFPKEFVQDASQFMLNTKETQPTELSIKIAVGLDLPFFVCTPIITEQRAIGVLMVGRLKEVGSTFPPLDKGDVETLNSISGLVSAIVQNMRVGILQEMDRLKTEFFANLSHEFRTPITLTLGAIDGIVAGRYGPVDNPEILNQADLIKRNQSRLLNLINQILDLEKLESGKVTLKLQRIGMLNNFLQRRLEQFHNITDKKGVELIYRGDETLESLPIYFDPERFDRMLFNLLSNAAKFTPKGSITLQAFVKEKTYGISVTDTGIGIKASQLPLIFDRFRQADGSASREYAGTGIGLSLVKQIAELHFGVVEVRSTYGTGTTFEILFPIGTAHFSANDIIEEVYSETDGHESPGTRAVDISEGKASDEEIVEIEKWNQTVAGNGRAENGNILYVVDNNDLRRYVRDLLKEEFNIYLAVDGRDGLNQALRFRPDVIVSDLMMPNMSGDQFLEAVRLKPELKETPFVLLTAKSGMESKLSSLAKGVDDYLNKPFSEVELRARVRNLLTIRSQQQRIRDDLIAARAIQRALLPKLQPSPLADGGKIDFQVVYSPCEILSGDFYDVISREDRIFFYIADVTSHGTAAAQCTYLIKAIANEIIENNSQITASALLETICIKFDLLKLDYSVAMQLGIYEKSSSLVSMVASGSPASLLRTLDDIEVVESKPGPLIGMAWSGEKSPTQGTMFESVHLTLEPGHQLYFVTDGCYEFNEHKTGKPWSFRKFTRLVRSCSKEKWQEELMNGIVEVSGSTHFEDDVTILRISRD